MLLAEVGLKCIGENDSMGDLLYESTGQLFHVPNFMINEPVFKKEFVVDKNEKEKQIEVYINLNLLILDNTFQLLRTKKGSNKNIKYENRQ